MVVDILAAWRVILNHAIIVIPENRLDLAHFIPSRAAIRPGDADMLPTHAVACDYIHTLAVLQLDDESAVVSKLRSAM